MPDLKPGDLTTTPIDYDGFSGSMAEAIEDELDYLLELDELPALLKDKTNREVRDRRRFLIAIARGVVRHLRDHPEAFVVVHGPDADNVQINADQLE